MINVEISIFDQKDAALVLGVLEAFRQRQILAIGALENVNESGGCEENAPGESIALPGKPLTVEELNEIIEMAEKGPKISHEEFKAKYGL